MNPYAKVIQKAAYQLRLANEEIKRTLTAHDDLRQYAEVTFNRIGEIEKSMYGLAGLPNDATIQVESPFKPLTKIMGIPVDTRRPVSEEDMKPTATEKEKFLARVLDFYDRVPAMHNEKVLHILREPSGEAILRGVAKKANVENWREHPLDVIFVEAIKAGIADQAEVAAAVAKAESFGSGLSDETVINRPWSKEIVESTKEAQPPIQARPPAAEQLPLRKLEESVTSAFIKSKSVQNGDEASGETDSKAAAGETVAAIGDGAENPLVAQTKQLKDEGYTNKEIAEMLNISQTTVYNYLKK